MSSNKKTIIISVIAIAIFIAVISYASYAFFTTTVGEKGNGGISGSTANLSTTFEDGEELNKIMIPGDTITKTFSIENNGSDISYQIVINNLVNEFTRYQDIIYTLKEKEKVIENGEETEKVTVLAEDKVFPNDPAKNELSDKRTLKNGERKTYTITITYQNAEGENGDQAPDMGKVLSGELFIKEL